MADERELSGIEGERADGWVDLVKADLRERGLGYAFGYVFFLVITGIAVGNRADSLTQAGFVMSLLAGLGLTAGAVVVAGSVTIMWIRRRR